MTNVLVDSSAWIGFFRGEKSFVRVIDALLSEGSAAVTGPVLAEVSSGARNRSEFALLSQKLGALSWLDAPENIWVLVAETRYALARQGIQAHLVDLVIAHTAHHGRCDLLTADRDFERIANIVPIELIVIERLKSPKVNS